MPDRWEGCYELKWKGIITDASHQHPAKMARGLLRRILDHAFEQGWVEKGSVVCDPFGGIGSTGIEGAYRGLQVVCVELEPRFCALAQQSFALHTRHWQTLGCPQPVMLQGDSRQLCEVVKEAGMIVGSPPFSGQESHTGGLPKSLLQFSDGRKRSQSGVPTGKGYGTTPGQLGAMKAGQFSAVVGSPPYAGALGNREHEGNQEKYVARQQRYNELHPEFKRPPAESMAYPNSPGQLASLPPGSLKVVLSSPPFCDSEPFKDKSFRPNQAEQYDKGDYDKRGFLDPNYKENSKVRSLSSFRNPTDTFWSAARTILEQCYQLLPPGGHALFVVKDFVRAKRRVDFTGDWRRLCEAVGFGLVCEHQAMLTREWEEATLFEGVVRKRKERKSFFRRLAESKGSPRIDFEVVQCFVKAPA